MFNVEFRKQVAKVFRECVQVERTDIFGENDPIPLFNQDDAKVMFPGLVSEGYVPGEGMVIMAINPAGGGDNDNRISTDHALYDAMNEFKKATENQIYEKFEVLNRSALESEQSWGGLTKYINAILEATGRQNNHVYMNAVPYRIRGDKANALPKDAFIRAYDRIISKQLEILKPRAIVVLGKTTDNVLGRYYRDKAPGYYVIPGTIGWRYVTKEAEDAIKVMKMDIVGGSKIKAEQEANSIKGSPIVVEEVEKNSGLRLKRTCGFESFLEDHFKKIGDKTMVELAKSIINGALDLSSFIRLEANTQWIKLMMPGYFFGIGPMVDGFNLAFRSRNIGLGNLAPYKSRRGEGEDWVYVKIKPNAKVTVQDIMEIVEKVNKVPLDLKRATTDEEDV